MPFGIASEGHRVAVPRSNGSGFADSLRRVDVSIAVQVIGDHSAGRQGIQAAARDFYGIQLLLAFSGPQGDRQDLISVLILGLDGGGNESIERVAALNCRGVRSNIRHIDVAYTGVGIVGGQVEAHRSELSCRHRLHGCT